MKSSVALKNALLGATGWAECFPAGFLIDIYSGPQPADASAAATGTKLGTISLNGSGAALVTDAPADGAITKPAAAVWSCLAMLAAGTAGYMRLYPHGTNPATLDATAKRVDFSVGVDGSTADARLKSTTFNAGEPFTLASFSYRLA